MEQENNYYGEMIKETEGLECLNKHLERLSIRLPFDGRVGVPRINENEGTVTEEKIAWFRRDKVHITVKTYDYDKRWYSIYFEDTGMPKSPIYQLHIKAVLSYVDGGFYDGYVRGIRATEVLVDFTYPGGIYPMRLPYNGISTVVEYVSAAIDKALA